MNYQKTYNSLIERGRNRILIKSVYFEKHHIVPKCLGGSNKKENLVRLTGEEHFDAHFMLTEIYPENEDLFTAFILMAGKNSNYKKIDAKIYMELRERHAENMSRLHKGVLKSKKARKKMSKAKSGKNNPNFGMIGEMAPMYGRKGKDSPNFGKTGEKNPFYDKCHSEKSLQKMRKPKSNTLNMNKSKRVQVFCVNDEVVYPSLIEASMKLGLNTSGISKVLRKKQIHTGGYKFEYVNNFLRR